MYKDDFTNFEELKSWVLDDKHYSGMNASTLNRYPIRFVLFDTFRQCSDFVHFVQQEIGAQVYSVDAWVDKDYPDIMMTYSELADRIEQKVKSQNGQDCVIAPFSELARFYDNEKTHIFDSLLKTIKGIEANAIGVEKQQRVYIPIVGLEGKMEAFSKDTQAIIWRYKAEEHEIAYRLILTDQTTYNVKGLEQSFTVVNTMQDWLRIWKDQDKQVRPNIISTSQSIYANAKYAQPDNAFNFDTCQSAYEFLQKGLHLQLGGLEQLASDGDNWEHLAELIDVSNGFSFDKFVQDYFCIGSIDGYQDFIRLWFARPAIFDRWLLTRYYVQLVKNQGLICECLPLVQNFGGNDLIEQIVLSMPEDEILLNERQFCLREAVAHQVILRDEVETLLVNHLEKMVAEGGSYTSALKYLTGISKKEKELLISWIGRDHIQIDQIKSIYPDIYFYAKEALGISVKEAWIVDYIAQYKHDKLANVCSSQIEGTLDLVNKSEAQFQSWYQNFRTVRTDLISRSDIDVFYWIDGLGIDWIPFVKKVISEHNDEGIYLNEVIVSKALLPSTTKVNKADLQKLLPEGAQLEKAGDLDNFAHQSSNKYPTYVIEELQIVRETIEGILKKYAGKKVAIISDHGLTYLSQKCSGLKLGGFTADHHGRLATVTGSVTADSSYIRLEDHKTVCALKHNSLCDKVPEGQGIHGGATPEEVLVPTFIISSAPQATNWSATLKSIELDMANPLVEFIIKGLPSTECPIVIYNGVEYPLISDGNDNYNTSKVVLVPDNHDMKLRIGNVVRDYKVNFKAAVKEDDPFAF